MTTSDLESYAWTQLDDDGTFYPEANVLNALNEGQRFFCLLTLCLETTATFTLSPVTPFYRMGATFSDWLLPRRILNSNGQRLRPGRLSDLDALDSGWQYSPGLPRRYALRGFDLLAIAPQPPVTDFLLVTYAQSPAPLVNLADVPSIPEVSHFALAHYASYALRQPEGGQEFSKFLGYFNDFLDEAQRLQKFVRAKNLDARYEKPPFELEGMDRSALMRWGSR